MKKVFGAVLGGVLAVKRVFLWAVLGGVLAVLVLAGLTELALRRPDLFSLRSAAVEYPRSERWWLVVTHKGSEEFEYSHEISSLPDRSMCEVKRQEQLARAAAIRRSVGPHYVMSVSACRRAVFLSGDGLESF